MILFIMTSEKEPINTMGKSNLEGEDLYTGDFETLKKENE